MDKLNPYTASFVLATAFVFTQSFQTATAAGCQVLSKETLEKKADPYDQSIRSAAQKYGVKEDLVKAVITVESCFKKTARGSSGEKGLMQLMPATARRFNLKNGYSAWQNVHAGTKYLSYLLARYDGDLSRTVAAYNAGEGNVRPGGKIRNHYYVSKVMSAYGKFRGGKSTPRLLKAKAETLTTSSKKRGKTSLKLTQADISVLPWSEKVKHRTADASKVRTSGFKVKPGYTVYEVMRQTGVPVKRLIRLNKLTLPYHLQAGQTLRLK
ncbi:LysM domain-containing protein [Thiothrix eikelboomii]|uniref:LysM domain-containing protein n=1 Tax=Thiothrix eikelboomii TaxID=92487 RepID=A0A1T4XQ52_9GAMM|nr:transglycosylase SLT domain-containing protein [Thiothrix eikelboomii]SKA91251.1 LysM domain-containing protein [Thiothrix eikelboomii]